MTTLDKFSLGIGDRFGHEGAAQLRAIQSAGEAGVSIVPVWNKSHREHNLIGSEPGDTRAAGEAAARATGYQGPFHFDADHIGLGTVDRFLPHCDFYTIDVAESIGGPLESADWAALRQSLAPLLGRSLPGLGQPAALTQEQVENFLSVYGAAIREAGRIYRRIEAAKGAGQFIAEVSTDEAETPQSPVELFLILGALAGEGVQLQTIAPKFTGRFNKGVDYVGDPAVFAREFEQDLIAIREAVAEFGLPTNLKISVHSGSDKFSLYRPIASLLRKHGAGLHLKTAGTTWLEELIGLALAGGDHLALAQRIYKISLGRIDELSQPYATVIDIREEDLPSAETVNSWDGRAFADALAHEPDCPRFNPSFRQLLHVSFKVAAEMGSDYIAALDSARETIEPCVTGNLLDRHIRPLFLE
ncbi:MAG: tagaturonate epimerase family protein [Terrimicrobiaceae bacterium]